MHRGIELDIKEFVTDPEKRAVVDTLNDIELAMITGSTYKYSGWKQRKLAEAKEKELEDLLSEDKELLAQEKHILNIKRIKNIPAEERTPEEEDILKRDNIIHTIRVVYFRRLTDWKSEKANETETDILAFIEDPTFVNFPELFNNAGTEKDTPEAKALRDAIKDGYGLDHPRGLNTLSDYEVEILGARIGKDGQAQVLITHNQTKFIQYGEEIFNFSQKRNNIPPKATIGELKNDLHTGQKYVVMTAPYFDRYGSEIGVEVTLPSKYTEVISSESEE
jgi:hypothetical protein